MGYGDAQRVGGKGDAGIDGIVRQDKLGLDSIYVQAKRWDGNVPPKEIQAFSGALDQAKASKGVFITTSQFSDQAKKSAEQIGKRIVLVDGDRLAELMIEHGIGVTEQVRYSIKKIDQDYFSGNQ
jgi:restriction system protein